MRPSRVGHYEIIDTLGEGGLATVYVGRHAGTRERVAIKAVTPSAELDSERLRALLLREASVLRRVAARHPAFVRVFDVIVDEYDQLFLIRELVDGVELSQWQKGRPARELVGLYTQIARALVVLHEANVAFRDLKPSNVLVDTAGHPRIVDFGLAVVTDQPDALTGPDTFIGTLLYVTPEAVRGQRVDTSADIYAFGMMLLEALIGRHPREPAIGASVSALLMNAFELPGRALGDLERSEGAALRGAITAMIALDPAERPSAAEVVRELERFSAMPAPGPVETSLKPVVLAAGPSRALPRPWLVPSMIAAFALFVLALFLFAPDARPSVAWALVFATAVFAFSFLLTRLPRTTALERRIRVLEQRLEGSPSVTHSMAIGAEQIRNTFDDRELERALRRSLLVQLENPAAMDPARALLVMQALRHAMSARQPSLVARLTPWVSMAGAGVAALVAGTGFLSSIRLLDFDDPPVIAEFRPLSPKIVLGGELDLEVVAEDPEHKPLEYRYTTTAGAVRGTGSLATLYAPRKLRERSIAVRVIVRDPAGQEAMDEVVVRVNRPPRAELTFVPEPAPGTLVRVTVAAADSDGDALSYRWFAAPGIVRKESDAVVYWQVPAESGAHEIGCTVSDGFQSVELRRDF